MRLIKKEEGQMNRERGNLHREMYGYNADKPEYRRNCSITRNITTVCGPRNEQKSMLSFLLIQKIESNLSGSPGGDRTNSKLYFQEPV